jgi:Glycosyltransferase family 9 (heptosyltransferase)
VAVAWERAPRLVVLRALGLGDLLTAVPALRGLARVFLEHERILAAPTALRPLVGLIELDGSPAVHRLVGVGPLEPLPPELQRPDIAVNLHGRGPESHRVLLGAGASRCLWFRNREVAESAGAPQWRAGEHEVVRWCRMLEELGVPADPGDLALSRPATPAAEWSVRGPTVVHPGAASAARRWPAERFAEVARHEAALGREVVVTGSPAERPLALAVARMAGLPETSVLAGRTDLSDLAAIVAQAGRVVCGDTGVGHLATAFGTPSVLLFGPTPPMEWGPLADGGRHQALWAGRIGDPHGDEPDTGLLSISTHDVLSALDKLVLVA